MTIAPYGSWPSPICTADLVAGSAGLGRSTGLIVKDTAYWTQANAAEGGRITLWRAGLDGSGQQEVAPGRYVRNSINEYGGGAWTAALLDGQQVVVYSDWPSGDVHLVVDGTDSVVAPGGDLRYGSLFLDVVNKIVLAVREDHRAPGLPVNTIVVLDLHGPNTDGGRVLAQGADFYARPTSDARGLVAWMQWDFPNMPWDVTSLMVAALDGSAEPRQIDGDASVVYPCWTPGGSLIYLSDESGFWNFKRWNGARTVALHQHPWDFCGPMWTPDQEPYALIDATHIGCVWKDDGFDHLGVLDTTTGELRPIGSPAVDIRVFGHGAQSIALMGYADKPSELVVLDWKTGRTDVLASNDAAATPDLAGCISVAQPIVFDGELGPVNAWYYPPTNANCTAPDGELPPVQVWSHGGPTGFASPAFSLETQFWTSRGIGIIDVNYSGSAGFGRDYRNRLKDQWGVIDVADCSQAVLALVDRGLADPKRLSIRGGSAGGYTTLAALVFTDVFAAGVSLYGIGDLEAMVTDTHKFESRYLDGLVAPYPQGRQTYIERSPQYHLDGLSCPMLILQGADDKVVPPQQAYEMAAAVEAKGLPVRLIVFEGEGHGFRKAESIIATEQAVLDFLGDVHGFTPHQ